jgi:hypothetical protein
VREAQLLHAPMDPASVIEHVAGALAKDGGLFGGDVL